MMQDSSTRPEGLFGWVRDNRIATAIIAVLVIALITAGLGLWQSPVLARGSSMAPPQSVKDFTTGMTNFDAQLMWNSLSGDMTQSLQLQGVDVSAIQTQLDSQKASGMAYTQVTYVGGHLAADGQAYYMYVMVRQTGDPAGNVQSVPYTFTVDNSGKISGIQ